MPTDNDSRLKRPPEPSAYEVGYGKPPVASRFKPGQSGNLKGRPEGSRNKVLGPKEERLREIVLAEAYRPIKVNEGKKQISVPMAEAIVRGLAVNAARGQLRAQQLFTKMLSETERALALQKMQRLETGAKLQTELGIRVRSPRAAWNNWPGAHSSSGRRSSELQHRRSQHHRTNDKATEGRTGSLVRLGGAGRSQYRTSQRPIGKNQIQESPRLC